MSLAQLCTVLRARWRSALLVFVLVLGAVAAFTAGLPRQYTAVAAVVLDVKSPDPIAGVVLPGMTVSSYMATQIDVLRSERVMLRAIEALGLDRHAGRQEAWAAATGRRGDFPAWLAAQSIATLDAKPAKDSNVIQVSITSQDAAASAALANAVVQAYIETTLELRTEPANQYKALFDERSRALRESLEAAQRRLSAFQQRKGLLVADERLDIETARMSELSSQLVVLQAQVNESSGRKEQASARADQMQEVLTNPVVTALTADLARQQARLLEIGQRFGEQHPQVQELTANIRELRARLDQERQRVTGSLAVNSAVNRSRLDELRRDLDQQRARVLELKGLRDEAAVLARDVENAQRAYDASFSRLSQSTLESQATQTNVSVLKVATAPPFPSAPRLSLNLAVGSLMAVGLALAVAVLRERLDGRLRTDSDVPDLLQQPLLGVIPRAPGAGHPVARLRGNRLLGAVPGVRR